MQTAAGVRLRENGSVVPSEEPRRWKEDSVSTLMATGENGSSGLSLHVWRMVVFGSIAALYVMSLFVPPLREALAKVFSYFPQ
jgi:hypothetical protein